MKEEMFGDDSADAPVPAAVSKTTGGQNAISFGSQMLAVGAGFCMFIMLLALFAAIQHRKRQGRSSMRSPLIRKSTSASSHGRLPSQAIPPPPQYLRCSNQCMRKCSSPGGSDYSLSSSYSSSAGSARSLSPMSPYGPHHQQGGYSHQLMMHPQQIASHQLMGGTPFAGINFIPYGTSPTTKMFNNVAANGVAEKQRYSFTTTTGTAGTGIGIALGGGNNPIPELLLDTERGRGSVSFQLAYDANNLALQITVLACTGLPKFATPANQSAVPLNPYIKLRLLPEGQHRVKTRILRDTQNPVFDEAFNMYGLSAEHLRKCRLHLAALAFDRYNGDTVLGEAVYDLEEFCADGPLSSTPKNVTLKWENREPFEGENVRGKARVALSFDSANRQMRFALLQISDLPKDATLGLLDPYAKIYALVNGQKRVAKHKTRVVKRTLCPQFGTPDDWLEFTLPENVGFDANGLPSALSFQVVVFNHDGVKRNEPIGQFTVDAESEQFAATFQKKNERLDDHHIGWHTINPF